MNNPAIPIAILAAGIPWNTPVQGVYVTTPDGTVVLVSLLEYAKYYDSWFGYDFRPSRPGSANAPLRRAA